MPDLLAASDPERLSHRAFGLRNLDVAGTGTPVQRTMGTVAAMALNTWDRYGMKDVDWQMMKEGTGQLFGQFLIDRDASSPGRSPRRRRQARRCCRAPGRRS